MADETIPLFPLEIRHAAGPIERAALESIRRGRDAGRLGDVNAALEAVIVATGADADVRIARKQSVAYTASVMLMLLQAAGLTPDLEAPGEVGDSDDDDLATVLRHGAAARGDTAGTG